MRIQILGVGCPKCRTLYENAEKAVAATGVDAVIERIRDIQQIMTFDILVPPGLVVNGEVKVVGRVASVEEIKRLIEAAQEHGPPG